MPEKKESKLRKGMSLWQASRVLGIHQHAVTHGKESKYSPEKVKEAEETRRRILDEFMYPSKSKVAKPQVRK